MTDNHYDIFSCDYHVHSEFSPCSEDMDIREIQRFTGDEGCLEIFCITEK